MGITQKIFFYNFSPEKLILILFFLGVAGSSIGQIRNRRPARPLESGAMPNILGQSRPSDTTGFEHRDDLADSITISYRFLDALNSSKLDSSINDYGKVFTIPTGYRTIGNNGNAAYPILFTPILKPGWDGGFHAFDVYKYTLENTRFFQTTRPYTQLSYLLASKKESVIKILHTQNIKPNWNAGINYQLISTPGIFQNQNTNHNSYRFFSNYHSKRKRYAAWMVLLANKLASTENGGIVSKSDLSDPDLTRRFTVPVVLGDEGDGGFNVFSTKLATGNRYDNFTAFFRHSYDFGIEDSIIINDSTTQYLFYPKLRFQHTVKYKTFSFRFQDIVEQQQFALSDAAYFNKWYGTSLIPFNGLNFWLTDDWKLISNDLVIRQFPQTKNLGQFIEAGLRIENLTGTFSASNNPDYLIQVFPSPPKQKKYFDMIVHGEYRNKTRNKKWDALLKGEFYAAGYHAADYSVFGSLTRFLNTKFGDVQLTFQNVNRTPSYIFNESSAFNLDSTSASKKENITVISVKANNPKFSLMARNISIANYTYFKNFYESNQYNGLVNITQITASTKNKIVGHLNLYSDFIVQQTTGKNPLRVPLFYTRQRLAFEGNFFKNLNLSTGIDVSYHTPYYANNYSPVMGAFFPQDTLLIKNLPKLNFFFNFRIKSFSAFVTAENLNTASFYDGFGFTNNNFTAPHYPTAGLLLRFGIVWRFVN